MPIYTYKCDECGYVTEVTHEVDKVPCVECLNCVKRMRIKITAPSMIVTETFAGRSLLAKDRPSNAEYQAYKAWEDAGGAADAPEREAFLRAKGEI